MTLLISNSNGDLLISSFPVFILQKAKNRQNPRKMTQYINQDV